MASSFKRLELYRCSIELADEVAILVTAFPRPNRHVGDQMLRAADSVGANIAEASGRWGYQDRKRFLLFARGSLYELEHWIDRAVLRSLSVPPNAPARVDELARMLNALIKRMDRERG